MKMHIKPYRLLPFRFGRKGDRVLLVNDVGSYYFIDNSSFNDLVNYNLNLNSQTYYNLKSSGFIYNEYPAQVIDWLATRYRTKKKFLFDFTALHMFVVTQRCNQKCNYCHASSIDQDSCSTYDMNPETARRCVDMVFKSPSSSIKIELQGGEPLLNFKTVKEIVDYSQIRNKTEERNLEIVLCSNLTTLDYETASYLKDKNVIISTSLDGPKTFHDSNRRLTNGDGTFDLLTRNLTLLKDQLDYNEVSALTTVTSINICHLRDVVDEYVTQGMASIFLRMVNPFGRAHTLWEKLGYNVERYLEAYEDVFEYLLDLNIRGHYLREEYATILLTKILTPFSTGFVDLQSPAGCGIGGVIYDTNGDIFISDEARMLARMGDNNFCIGNVYHTTWKEAFGGKKLREIIKYSCIESLPGCAWCVYQTYCGCDPVRNYAKYGDLIGIRPNDDFCKLNMGILDILFKYLHKKDDRIIDVFWSWVTGRSLGEIWEE